MTTATDTLVAEGGIVRVEDHGSIVCAWLRSGPDTPTQGVPVYFDRRTFGAFFESQGGHVPGLWVEYHDDGETKWIEVP